MKTIVMTLAGCAVALSAYAEPIADRERALAVQVQAEQQRRIEQAREKCLAHHGADCDTVAGLQEWLLQDRSRADAVLDRVAPLGSASAGASGPVRSDVPATSPRHP